MEDFRKYFRREVRSMGAAQLRVNRRHRAALLDNSRRVNKVECSLSLGKCASCAAVMLDNYPQP